MSESSTTHVGDAAKTLLQPFRLGTDFELPNKILMAERFVMAVRSRSTTSGC